QWTPILEACPEWMRLGFAIYEGLHGLTSVFEVFPSASLKMFAGNRDARVTIDFSAFSTGPKDILDACVAALTVFEFVNGRGCEIGGGDGLGTIIIPGSLSVMAPIELLRWPAQVAAI